jgi:hypothetical protein
MSEWLDNQKKQSCNIRKLLQERIEKVNPRRELTAEESNRLRKLEGIADKLNRGENVQNRQLRTWLTEDEYEQLEYEWQERLELRRQLRDKPSELKRYEEKLKQATFNYNRAEGYGSKLLEFAKGKNAIELATEAEVADVLAKVREAVENGELDSLIGSAY